jgi:hypothetical protein
VIAPCGRQYSLREHSNFSTWPGWTIPTLEVRPSPPTPASEHAVANIRANGQARTSPTISDRPFDLGTTAAPHRIPGTLRLFCSPKIRARTEARESSKASSSPDPCPAHTLQNTPSTCDPFFSRSPTLPGDPGPARSVSLSLPGSAPVGSTCLSSDTHCLRTVPSIHARDDDGRFKQTPPSGLLGFILLLLFLLFPYGCLTLKP